MDSKFKPRKNSFTALQATQFSGLTVLPIKIGLLISMSHTRSVNYYSHNIEFLQLREVIASYLTDLVHIKTPAKE